MEKLNYSGNFANAYKLGAWSSILLLVYSVATILVVTIIGGPPGTVNECFAMLKENRVTGLLRLDILTVFVMPLYYVLFYAIYRALKGTNIVLAQLSALLVFVGVTVFLSAPSVFSYLKLSDGYWNAANEKDQSHFIAAAESILASDIWNGTGARLSGLLLQTGALIFSVLMLRSASFTKFTALQEF